MKNILDFPLVVFTFSFFGLWLAAFLGGFFRKKLGPLEEDERSDFAIVQGAALTLLGLLVGFTFSMAISRYEQRKNYEEEEANAIGTEYVRTALLPTEDAARLRDLLTKYLDQRVLFYSTPDAQRLRQIRTDTSQLQNEMWSIIQSRAAAQPTPTVALSVSGMNDVLNSQGYTQAAWWNRIPLEAWLLLAAIAMGCNLLIGYGAHRTSFLFIVIPLAVSVSLFLIADIDSPRGGVIRVHPQNLISLSQSLRTH
ncbi:MAG TPA: hypothetical protein VNZ03_29245 [Terriglobales bacterium]|nr:hypothetical protein [Terriglobales bacterium]